MFFYLHCIHKLCIFGISKQLNNKTMTNESITQIIEALKESVKEMVSNGATLFQCIEFLGKKLGNDLARLIACDLALDLGMNEQVEEYLKNF